MIIAKEGVRFRNMWPEIYLILPMLDELFREHGVECVITSWQDGIHSNNSMHYRGMALDLRSHHLPRQERWEVFQQIRHNLGSDYDVLYEDPGGLNEHYHIEFDRD